MGNVNVAGLIKDADAKLKMRDELVPAIAAVREILRYSVSAGEATKDEAKWIAEAFPPREKKENAAENGAAATAPTTVAA
jgi:transcription elongation factor GreA-like protein